MTAAPGADSAVGVFAGLCTLDVVHRVERLPGADEKVTALEQFVAAGGPAANAAVTFAALGGDAVLVSVLGTGAAADVARADLEAHGVRVVDVAPSLVDAVPVSAIRVEAGTGARSVVSTDAHGVELADVPDVTPLVESAAIVLVDGHHPELASAVARAGSAAGLPVVLDAGRWRPVMRQLVPLATAAICSSAFRLPDMPSPIASASALASEGATTVAVTQGAGPVLWWHGGRRGEIEPPRVDAVDTSGAGDVFHGAFCRYAVHGMGAEECLTRAAAVAALKCTSFGTRGWLRGLPG